MFAAPQAPCAVLYLAPMLIRKLIGACNPMACLIHGPPHFQAVSRDKTFSVGPSTVDPRSGEIVNADIGAATSTLL